MLLIWGWRSLLKVLGGLVSFANVGGAIVPDAQPLISEAAQSLQITAAHLAGIQQSLTTAVPPPEHS